MTQERWQALMSSLGVTDTSPTYDALVGAYSEKHRHYHTIRHVDDCLEKLDVAKDFAKEPAKIEVALWFHDAVYDPYKSGNEEKSAEWAYEFLTASGVAIDVASRVRSHILATKHEAVAEDADSRLLVDIDLSILGAEEAEYDAFEKNVREEYKWVPGFVFNKKRAEILQSFLDRPQLYSAEYFRSRYEAKARENLRGAIARLTG
ncbi:MAG: hypothetical protein H7Y02_00925 [Candidatus Obscuribacterales bacterium]|nr:hypothetical protein [Steroidobacteraceae bacterium]